MSKRSKNSERFVDLVRLYCGIECHERSWQDAKDTARPASSVALDPEVEGGSPQVMNDVEGDLECEIVKGFTRDLLHVAEGDIKLADFNVRNNRGEGVPDDPESTRKIRLSFRRVRYRLMTMATVDSSLGAEMLIGRLRNVGKPFGRLRDAEILESTISEALGDRADTPQGRQLLAIAAHARRVEQQTADHLLDSDSYRETLNEVSEFRRSLPSHHSTPDMLRPMAERAMRVSWRKLRRVAIKAKRDPTDINLHRARIAAKRTLYAAQALSDVLGAPIEEFVRKVDEFQKYLGNQHDLVIASTWFARVSKDYPALHDFAKSLAREERKRADKRSKRWTKYWKSVETLTLTERW
jgi:CHAD domain-containing protein